MTSYRLLFCDHMKTLIVNTDTQFSWIGSSSKDNQIVSQNNGTECLSVWYRHNPIVNAFSTSLITTNHQFVMVSMHIATDTHHI